MKITIQQALEKMTFEELKNEYLNTFQKDFLAKYNTSTKTCQQLFGNKNKSFDWSRKYIPKKPVQENPRGLNTEKWVNKEHTYKIIGEFREIRWMKGLNLQKNSGYMIQH